MVLADAKVLRQTRWQRQKKAPTQVLSPRCGQDLRKYTLLKKIGKLWVVFLVQFGLERDRSVSLFHHFLMGEAAATANYTT